MAIREKDLNLPKILRAHRPKHADVESSGIPPADVATEREIVTEDVPYRQRWIREWFRAHLLQVGTGMLLMFALWFIGITYVLPFTTQTIDHWNCGENRICQYDLNVGHNGTSHFIAEYWHDQIIVIEMQGDKVEHSHVYSQQITGDDKTPRIVTLTTAYISRNPIKGKPDLVASVSGFAIPVIFYNTGDGFTTEPR